MDDTAYESHDEEDGNGSDASNRSENKQKNRKRKRNPASSSPKKKNVRPAHEPPGSSSSSAQLAANAVVTAESSSASHRPPSALSSNTVAQPASQFYPFGITPSFSSQQGYNFVGANPWWNYYPNPNTQPVFINHPLSSSQGHFQLPPTMPSQGFIQQPQSQPATFSEAAHSQLQVHHHNATTDIPNHEYVPPSQQSFFFMEATERGESPSISDTIKREKAQESQSSPPSSSGERSVSASHERPVDVSSDDKHSWRRVKPSSARNKTPSDGGRTFGDSRPQNLNKHFSSLVKAESPSRSPRRNSQKPSPKGVFTTAEGEPMSFWVQTDMRDRKELLVLIKVSSNSF